MQTTKRATVFLNDEASVATVMLLEDRNTIQSSRVIRDSGEMIAPVTIARTGIMLYRAKELGDLFSDRDPESVIRVMTTPEVLFDAETIESCRSLPATIGHPSDDVSVENMKELSKGFLEGSPVPDGSALAGHIVLNDKDAIRLVDSGTDQISLGHKAELMRVEGKDWDCEKTKIRGNHVAIVVRGRAQTTRISDSGEEIPIVDKVELDRIEAERDSALQKVEELKVSLKDSQEKILSDEDILAKAEALAEARIKLLSDVHRLGDMSDMDFSGKGEKEIKRMVVSKLMDSDLKDKSDDYINARFEIALEDAGEETLSDALTQSITSKVQDQETVQESPAELARKRRAERYSKY